MNKKIILGGAAILIVAIGIAGYFYFEKPEDKAVEEIIVDSISSGVLPTIDPQSNPLEEAPDVNPASNGNPIKNVKTNPFE